MLWNFFYTWPIKKMPNQRHISEFAELDGEGQYSGKKNNLQGCKSNRKFYRSENQTYITVVKNTINLKMFIIKL